MPTTEPSVDLNRKAYIRSWERKAPPDYDEVNYCFAESAQDATTWEDRESAEEIAASLNIGGVTVPSLRGDTHTLRNFAVEEYSDKFVIFCSGPFDHAQCGTAYPTAAK